MRVILPMKFCEIWNKSKFIFGCAEKNFLFRNKWTISLLLGGWRFHFYKICVKLASNQDKHKTSDEFAFQPDRISHFGVTSTLSTRLGNLQITRTAMKSFRPDRI